MFLTGDVYEAYYYYFVIKLALGFVDYFDFVFLI